MLSKFMAHPAFHFCCSVSLSNPDRGFRSRRHVTGFRSCYVVVLVQSVLIVGFSDCDKSCQIRLVCLGIWLYGKMIRFDNPNLSVYDEANQHILFSFLTNIDISI